MIADEADMAELRVRVRVQRTTLDTAGVNLRMFFVIG
jgi:hypothetical protein